MNDYIQASVFILVIVLSFYQGFCIAPEPRPTVPFKSGGDASLSFITGESGGPPKNIPKPSNPTRDFVGPQIGQPNRNLQNSQQSLSYNQNIPQSPGRDFVNSNVGNIKTVSPTQPPVGNVGPTTSKSRDFVNPNWKPGQSNIQQSQIPTTKSPISGKPDSSQGSVSLSQILNPGATPNSGTRDFVNPNYKPKDPFPTLKPVSPRDPFPPLKPNVGFRPKEPFPALNSKDPQPVVPGSVISYANKASGGVTTARPIVNPSGGQIGNGVPSTSAPVTEKKYEEGPQDNELREFSEALLKKDVNNANKYVKLNIQGKTTSGSKDDQAPQNLLEINQEAFKVPTIEKLRSFYNNYILEVTENEFVTPQEKSEENDFLDAVIATQVMQHAKNFLISNGKLGKDPKEFKDLLRTTWFSMYSRGHGKVGSSGFEHIFLAELKKDKNEVSGLHNWVYFHEAEKNKLVNYLGYMKKIDLGEKGAILKFHFSLNDVDKPVSSIFIGTSPELEMALYTTCYIFRPNRVCPLRLNGHNFIVRAYSLKYRGKQLLGSAFPEI